MYIIDDKFIQRANNNFLKRNNSSLNKDSFDLPININKNNSSRNIYSRNKDFGFNFRGDNNNNKNNFIKNYKTKSYLNRANSLPQYNTQYSFYPKNQVKGTSLPEQFDRKNFYQIPSLFKNFQNNINNNNISDKNIKNSQKKNKSYQDVIKIGIRERMYKPYLWDNVDKKELIDQRDKLMPEGFQFYEKLLKKENKKYFENNYIIKKQPNKKLVPVLIRDMYKEKIEESDIFFQNKNIKKKDLLGEISKNKEIAMKTFYSSDIFNKRIDPSIIKKSGEISYFKNKEKKEENKIENLKYTKNTETPTGWGVRESFPCLLNYCSTKFNPLNPGIKNFCKTKDNIINECNKKYKGYNPTNKQKSISEFIDLTNVNASNYNNDYNKVLNNNPNAFKKNENMFTELYNVYNNYNNILEKPFFRFIPSLNDSNDKSISNSNVYNPSNINSNNIKKNESQTSNSTLIQNK